MKISKKRAVLYLVLGALLGAVVKEKVFPVLVGQVSHVLPSSAQAQAADWEPSQSFSYRDIVLNGGATFTAKPAGRVMRKLIIIAETGSINVYVNDSTEPITFKAGESFPLGDGNIPINNWTITAVTTTSIRQIVW